MRPTKVGQMVEVDTRAGRVTRVYPGLTSEETQDGEPAPTHVDVCFILGNAITEKKIPISDVRLAPELDPNSGRGSRHTAKLLSPSNKDELGNDGTPNEGKLAANHGIISPGKTNAIVLPGASA